MPALAPTDTPSASGPPASGFADLAPTGVDRSALLAALERHEAATLPRLRLLWSYYRNPMENAGAPAAGALGSRGYRLAQERGLPSRITGGRSATGASVAHDDRAWARKEVVVENDIAWRIHTMVDFMFGRRVSLRSAARDPALARTIEQAVEAVWEASGGIALLQDMGLLGHVYGHVDLLVRAGSYQSPGGHARADGGEPSFSDASHQGPTPRETGAPQGERGEGVGAPQALISAARSAVRVEVIEPTRGVALLSPDDYRRIDAYILRYQREDRGGTPHRAALSDSESPPALGRFLRSILGAGAFSNAAPTPPPRTTITEVIGPHARRVYETDSVEGRDRTRLIDSGPSLVDPARPSAAAAPEAPIVHIQNLSQPFHFGGLSEVEPLIPLQDELNTRLSDRASRVTMSSFRMYLAKGLEGAGAAKLPVAPGIVWSTDNPEAAVSAFGGDAAAPSEDRHIDEVREAMDKQSGVPPLAAGVVRAKIGNLSSQTALRLTLSGLLSKTARKRVAYGRGLARACELILEALDALGILHTDPANRTVHVDWPEPLPRDEADILTAAKAKLDLGIPRERILAELGYAPEPAGEV